MTPPNFAALPKPVSSTKTGSLIRLAALFCMTTLALTQPSNAQQNPSALMQDATQLHNGNGVPQNHKKAFSLYKQAADLGDVDAQNQVGKYLFEGRGVTADPEAALIWLRTAAQSGNPDHLFDLAVALETFGTPEDAATHYQEAANAGHMESIVSLGVLYQNGTGVTQDYEKAVALYVAAADAGHARAQNNLGLLFVRGHGVAQNYEQAVALFAASADQGLPQAMTNLGVMYDNGFGVAQSDEAAAEWYRRGGRGGADTASGPVYDPRLAAPPTTDVDRAATFEAARLGDPVAQFLAGWMLLERAESGDSQAAGLWFAAAADRGHVVSMANLARLHFLGQGVLQDYVSGQMWATLALAGGLPQAERMAQSMGIVVSPEQLAAAQELAAQRWQGMQDGDAREISLDFETR